MIEFIVTYVIVQFLVMPAAAVFVYYYSEEGESASLLESLMMALLAPFVITTKILILAQDMQLTLAQNLQKKER